MRVHYDKETNYGEYCRCCERSEIIENAPETLLDDDEQLEDYVYNHDLCSDCQEEQLADMR